jgi:hypothetical protein
MGFIITVIVITMVVCQCAAGHGVPARAGKAVQGSQAREPAAGHTGGDFIIKSVIFDSYVKHKILYIVLILFIHTICIFNYTVANT